jgi:hypothetical protein
LGIFLTVVVGRQCIEQAVEENPFYGPAATKAPPGRLPELRKCLAI